MIVTVCQLRVERAAGPLEDWPLLVAHARAHHSDLVLLPEMAFYPWPFGRRRFDQATWDAAEAAHKSWLPRLGELAPAVVAGSRPVTRNGEHYNEAFLWSVQDGYTAVHDKYYLPDEAGFWEGSWYRRGDGRFEVAAVPAVAGEPVAGFLICTELWFLERARAYGQAGASLLLVPRATERHTVDKWLAAGRVAAMASGAYALSSNHYHAHDEPFALGGQGWVADPEGEVLALTSPSRPFASVEIDLGRALEARTTYPRYVEE
ncbi:MAG: carbon-nitrogen hydrolase family protein [Anaerolineae bacterium]|nr:carbon-nitrogen hydrolase family protein [Anaerolineae bacterium]